MRLKGEVLDEWPVFTTLVDADKVINVPVAKHHNLAKYTAAMKNWYGVLGGRRNRLHQNIDVSIADLATFMRPSLVVVDARRVLDAQRPAGRQHRRRARTCTRSSRPSIRSPPTPTAARSSARSARTCPTSRWAQKRGLGTMHWENLRVEGGLSRGRSTCHAGPLDPAVPRMHRVQPGPVRQAPGDRGGARSETSSTGERPRETRGCDARSRPPSDPSRSSRLARARPPEESEAQAPGHRHPRAPRRRRPQVGAALLAGRLLRPLHVLPLPDRLPRHLRRPGRRARSACRCRSRAFLLADPFVGGDDAPLDAHRLPRAPLERRACSRSRWSSVASSAAGSAPSARSTTSSRGSSRRGTGRGAHARRGEQDARLPAREVLPALRLPRRGRRAAAPSAGSSTPSASPCARSASASSRRAVPDAPRPRRRAGRPRSRADPGAPPTTRRTSSRRRSGRRKQFYFHQTWLIVFLLVAVLFANRFIPRFWCRVLCPLGAFLGVFSRFALFGMEKDHAKCTDCNLCLVHCQGAD